jgi:hypothetical protein
MKERGKEEFLRLGLTTILLVVVYEYVTASPLEWKSIHWSDGLQQSDHTAVAISFESLAESLTGYLPPYDNP